MDRPPRPPGHSPAFTTLAALAAGAQGLPALTDALPPEWQTFYHLLLGALQLGVQLTQAQKLKRHRPPREL